MTITTPQRAVTISKFLSKYLRHAPQSLGLTLEPGGWVSVKNLLEACQQKGFPITQDELREVVENNDKQRFSFDEKHERIRANQGHSTSVDLQLEPRSPPATLFHGTGEKRVPAILAVGILKMQRHHVHLSVDRQTAVQVGSRHGKPVVFVVDAAAMAAGGAQFYCSENGVWLVKHVPPEFIRVLGQEEMRQ